MRFTSAAAAGTAALALGVGSLLVGVASVSEAPSPSTTVPTTDVAAPATDGSTTTTSTPSSSEAPAVDSEVDGSGPVAEVHDVFSATPAPRGDGSDDPIGGVHPGAPVPEGIDLTSFPGDHGDGPIVSAPVAGGGSFSAGKGCEYQCITSGVAYPRGFGAELVVGTSVPAELWLSVIGDVDQDGDHEYAEYRESSGPVTEFAWSFDDLEPGQTYYAMVTATDEHGDVSYAWGEFTTLTERTVSVAVSHYEVFGGPTNVENTSQYVRLEGDELEAYGLGEWIELDEVDGDLDLDLVVARYWEASVCEATWTGFFEQPQGDDDAACLAWNTATGSIDLGTAPASGSHWDTSSFEASVRTPTGAGNALPNGYGDPRFFHVEAVVQVVVEYH